MPVNVAPPDMQSDSARTARPKRVPQAFLMQYSGLLYVALQYHQLPQSALRDKRYIHPLQKTGPFVHQSCSTGAHIVLWDMVTSQKVMRPNANQHHPHPSNF